MKAIVLNVQIVLYTDPNGVIVNFAFTTNAGSPFFQAVDKVTKIGRTNIVYTNHYQDSLLHWNMLANCPLESIETAAVLCTAII